MSYFLPCSDGTKSYWCRGCECAHRLDGRWLVTFDRDGEPNVSPSVYVRSPTVCHALIRHGLIEYLNDSSHELAGQTVPMTDWEEVP